MRFNGTWLAALFVMLSTPMALAQTIDGTVFRDYDADGVNDISEPGVGGITVDVFDGTGASAGSATTLPNGTYSAALTVGAGTDIRVEFSSLPAFLQPGPFGSASGTTVIFAQSGDSGIDVGLNNPGEHCESSTVDVATPCFLYGDQLTGPFAAGDALVALAETASGNSPPKTLQLPAQDIGAVWGLAYRRQTNVLYSGAFIKRHVGLGPIENPTTIYVTDLDTNVTSEWLTLDAARSDPHPNATADFLRDFGTFDDVLKDGLGDVDISEDGNTLYAVDLGTRELVIIPINADGSPGTPTMVDIVSAISTADVQAQCTDDTSAFVAEDLRPFGLGINDGQLYLGVVCSAQSTVDEATELPIEGPLTDNIVITRPGDQAKLRGYVFLWDGGSSFSEVLDFPLVYERGCSNNNNNGLCLNSFDARWNAWIDTYPFYANQSQGLAHSGHYSMPAISDIEFDSGDMILGLVDRFGHQAGPATVTPVHPLNALGGEGTLGPMNTGGDLLRACADGAGGWGMEELIDPANTGCGTAGTSSNRGGGLSIDEYYYQDSISIHSEQGVGGLLQIPGRAEVVTSSINPTNTFNSGGLVWHTNADGSKDKGARLYLVNGGTPALGPFGKANGFGDVAAFCAAAPIEIGNRAWCDGNINGIQDPGEANVNDGVQFRLICDVDNNGIGTGTDLTANTTMSGGQYLFNDANVTGGVPTGTLCRVEVTLADLAASCGGVLAVAPPNADPAANGDLHDSDGINNSGNVEVDFTTGGSGANNHTYDLGFVNVLPTDDFGDAPDPTYPTLAASSGASHTVVVGTFLGSTVDEEPDGQPSAAATGDGSDEDGVTFDNMVVACGTSNVTVTASVAGALDAWIDFNDNGSWSDAGEQIFTSQALSAGANAGLVFTVPCGAVSANTFARFRFSTAGGLSFDGGPAADGEVEDYLVTTKGLDLGDAPDSYGTLIGSTGARHVVDPGTPLYLGACVDTELDGQPATSGNPANGDDIGAGLSDVGGCAGPDDEDGATFDTMIVACSTTNQVTVTSVGAGALLDAWIDFDGDGDFADGGEQVFTSQALTGSDALMFAAPCSTESGLTYARFRVSSTGGLSSSGAAMSGEVEDYQVTTKGIDLGDAPDSYGTMNPATAAVHPVNPSTPLYLGACVDTEAAGQPNATATGDDSGVGLSTVGACTTANDDEDGVTFDTMIVACSTTNQVTVTSVGTGLLDGWIDFNDDGDFADAGEQIFTSQGLTGSDVLAFTAPCTAESATTYARFRVSSTGGLGSAGAAMDGEVEDYEVTTKGLDFGDAPDTYTTTASPSHVVDPGTPLHLGVCVDTELLGQPGAGADLDDTTAGLSVVGTCAANDDEDGVTFDTMIVACSTTNMVTVTSVGSGALLDGWIDFDGDGTFSGAGEQIFTSQALTGSDTLSYMAPCDAESGDTFARFRVSTAGGQSFDGAAMDGEVEDYPVTTKGLDYGDAPDTYGTSAGAGGPSHAVDPNTPLFLGACVDTEVDGQPVMAGNPADGDDLGAALSTLGTCAGADDEDGVTFDTMIAACGTADVTVMASQAGMLDAWIDFNGDGDFADTGEQIFVAQPLAAGTSSEAFAVPCDTAINAVTYARFRVSTVGGLGATGGPALNGEVEDYAVATKGVDFGDAPDSYSTSQSTSGPSHVVDLGSPLFLGACVDTEADGQPVMAGNPADGDDLGVGSSVLGTCTGNDDEDGVIFDEMVIACGTSNLTVTASQTGLLDAWIDFNGDGDFADPGEQILASQAVTAGANAVPYAVSCTTATTAVSYARFRLSTAGGLLPGGPAMDGEVEDYELATKGLDLGDAPEADGYPTLIVSDGARHVVQPIANPSLAGGPDTEPDGQPTASHLGDDQNGSPDDEDGVSFAGVFVPGGGPIDVTLTAGATGGLVNAWIDWNQDGDWDDPGEQIATDLPVAAGASEVVMVAAPAGIADGMSCSRFRIDSAGGLLPTGLAMDGEIEDYPVAIGVEDPVIGISKELISVQDLGAGEHAALFEITVVNLGNVKLSNVQVTVDLATAFADAEGFALDFASSSDLTISGSFDGDGDPLVLESTDMLDIGETGTILLQVLVMPGSNAGPYVCSSLADGTSPAGTGVTDVSQDGGDADPDNDGDPSNNDDPTEIIFQISIIEIPTLGSIGFAALAAMLALLAMARLRRLAWQTKDGSRI